MTNDDIKRAMRSQGRADALDLQERSPNLTGTELNAEDDKIPSFRAAVAAKNMLERTAGQKDGFVCRSTAGRVVRLLQVYDSSIYTQEPEQLPTQWGFVWSDDPAKAKPFISLSQSPYMTGNCCTENGITHRSTIDNNVWAPSAYQAGWAVVA